MGEETSRRVLWRAGAEGGTGGYFLRSNVGEFAARLEAEGKRVAGIVYDTAQEDIRLLEFIVIEPKSPAHPSEGSRADNA